MSVRTLAILILLFPLLGMAGAPEVVDLEPAKREGTNSFCYREKAENPNRFLLKVLVVNNGKPSFKSTL